MYTAVHHEYTVSYTMPYYCVKYFWQILTVYVIVRSISGKIMTKYGQSYRQIWAPINRMLQLQEQKKNGIDLTVYSRLGDFLMSEKVRILKKNISEQKVSFFIKLIVCVQIHRIQKKEERKKSTLLMSTRAVLTV